MSALGCGKRVLPPRPHAMWIRATSETAYEGGLPPPGFTTPAAMLPSVPAPGTWLPCRLVDSLTSDCN